MNTPSSDLMIIQSELKAPKSKRNNFGNYQYRSCEDILEAVKPLLVKYKCQLYLSDVSKELAGVPVIIATATFIDSQGNKIDVSAEAAVDLHKKGMDHAQTFGTSSSYARKYALNGLFLIDDTKDADTDEYHNQVNQAKNNQPANTRQSKPTNLEKLDDARFTDALKAVEQGKYSKEKLLTAFDLTHAQREIASAI